MRHVLPVTAESTDMQGLSRVSISPDYASFLIPTDRLVQDWDNPHPVAVMLQPVVKEGGGLGLLVGERKIRPIGGVALAGGFMQKGETPQQAALRELGEESGFAPQLLGDPRYMDILTALPTPGGQLLIFVQNQQRMQPADVRELRESDEMRGWHAYDGRSPLCFPLHQQVADAWLARNGHRETPDNVRLFAS